MNCISSAVELFKTNTCPAVAIAVAAFVLGAIATCLLCRICRPCGKNKEECQRRQGQGQRRGDAKPEARFEKTHPAPADGSIEIYVGNLSYDLTEDQLRKEFEKFGTVGSARIVTDKNGQRSKGFGFVVMPNRPEAEAAIAAMSEKEFMGRKMRVNEARNTIKEDA